MSGIVYDANKIKVYENLCALCDFAGESREWGDALWQEILTDTELYDELLYYINHHTLKDDMKCQGYKLTDLFVWQMDRYNLLHDTGKNTVECRKVDMVLRSFVAMAGLKNNPESWMRRLSESRGMDRL